MTSLSRSVAALALVFSLTACGGGGSDDKTADTSPTDDKTTALSADAADGDTISTDDFTYTLPKGWQESTQSSAITVAIDAKDRDGFADNFNVVRDNTVVGVGGDQLEDAVEHVLGSAKATDIKVKDRIQIDGEDAVHVGAIFTVKEMKYRTEQYAVSHGDAGYVVTVSFSPDVPAAERDALSESILTTWKWES